ncbi:glycosyltransferase [Candidatus Latescibacterota bacterium]
MNICVLTHTYPRFPDDINAPFVEHLMEEIARQGNEISVLTAFDPAWNRCPDDHTVDLRTYRYIWPERLHILGYSRTIEGNVRFRKRIMILSPFLFAGAYRAFLKLVREKKPDILHAHWILPNGFIAARVSRVTGVPLLIQTHGSDVFTAEQNPLFRWMARTAASQAAFITCPSPDMIRRMGAVGIDTGKIGLVPNAVQADFAADVSDKQAAALKTSLGIPPGNLVVLAMGRMVHVKGFSYLLDAFKRVAAKRSDVTLVLAGGGVLYDDLRTLARESGMADRVVMPGTVMRNQVPVYYRMADVFVVPSVRHESGAVDGLPVVVPEAMAAGLPVVASEIGGIPVLIRDGVNGILVAERDSAGIAGAVLKLLGNRDLRDRFGERSRHIIRDAVNYRTVAEYYRKLYHTIAFERKQAADLPPFEIPSGDA